MNIMGTKNQGNLGQAVFDIVKLCSLLYHATTDTNDFVSIGLILLNPSIYFSFGIFSNRTSIKK